MRYLVGLTLAVVTCSAHAQPQARPLAPLYDAPGITRACEEGLRRMQAAHRPGSTWSAPMIYHHAAQSVSGNTPIAPRPRIREQVCPPVPRPPSRTGNTSWKLTSPPRARLVEEPSGRHEVHS